MSDTVLLSWNFTNWVTVILMALIGWVIWKAVNGFVNPPLPE